MISFCFGCNTCSGRYERSFQTAPKTITGGRCPSCGSASTYRDYPAEQGCQRSGEHGWPHESYAASVNPEQVEEAEKHCSENGVPTSYNPHTGDPIMRSRAHRKRFHRMMGLCDRDAGYGDAAPEN